MKNYRPINNCDLAVAFATPRFSRKRALNTLFACLFISSVYFYTLWTVHSKSKTRISVDVTAKRASALHSSRFRHVESSRTASRSASPVGSFDFEFAELKFQRVMNASAVGRATTIVLASVSCDSAVNDSARVLTDDFSEIVEWASTVRHGSKLLHSVKSATPRVFITGCYTTAAS